MTKLLLFNRKETTMRLACFLLFCSLLSLHAQDTTDVARLRVLKYMTPGIVERVNCDKAMDNLSARVCANLAFQESDAEMNQELLIFLEELKNDSIRLEEQQYHQTWVLHRRRQSHEAADGYRGHLLGIIYLGYMTRITEIRTEELRFLNRAE